MHKTIASFELEEEKKPIIITEPTKEKRQIFFKDGPKNLFAFFETYIGESLIKCTEGNCDRFVEDPPPKKILIRINDICIGGNSLKKDYSTYKELSKKIIKTLEDEYMAAQLLCILGPFCSNHLPGFLSKHRLGLGTKEPIASNNVPGP